jgi:predicted AlkP superfamily pyrophosphatase or phosphodiesterase
MNFHSEPWRARTSARMIRIVKKLLAFVAAATILMAAPAAPKLVLVVVLDQFRYDYLTRFRGEFHGGLDRLLKQGANFSDAHHTHFPTITACGHALLLTGAPPSVSGIVGNDWFDRSSHQHVTSVSDNSTKTVGGTGDAGASPQQLLVSTLGDEMKKADRQARVVGISAKDRSAILLTGRNADGAYWFDEKSGNFVTSTYYRATLPEWLLSYDKSHPADQLSGTAWLDHKLPEAGPSLYKAVLHSPYINELTEAVVERAVVAEKLGKRQSMDLLAVSLSGTDYVGHDYGPDSAELRDTVVRADRVLGKIFAFLDHQVGMGSVLVVLTSDHGVAPIAGPDAEPNGGQVKLQSVTDAIQAALTGKYGPGEWVAGTWDEMVYINDQLIAAKKLDRAEVNRIAADAVRAIPHIARAYTREQLMEKHADWDETGHRMQLGFHPARGADIEFLPERNWVFLSSSIRTTHGTTYDYDTHVPLILMGPGVRQGSYDIAVSTMDLAPTLARILGVTKPSGSAGRVLMEALPK